VPANTGIGLAVPADVAQSVVLQLARFGQVRRGRFGVTAQDVTPAVAQALGLDVRRGALISNVAPSSAAERAGLAHGDVVLAVDGRPLRGAAQMRNRIGLVPLGDEAVLSVLRGDRMLKLHMHAEAAPPAPAESDSPSARPRPAARDQIDL
jgi:serine protease DegQ